MSNSAGICEDGQDVKKIWKLNKNLFHRASSFSHILFPKVWWHFTVSWRRSRSYQIFCWGCWILQCLLFLLPLSLSLVFLCSCPLWAHGQRPTAVKMFKNKDHMVEADSEMKIKILAFTSSGCPDSFVAQRWSSFSWLASSPLLSSFLGCWCEPCGPINKDKL